MAMEENLDNFIGKKAEVNADDSIKTPAKFPLFRIDGNPASSSDDRVGLDATHFVCVPIQYDPKDLDRFKAHLKAGTKSTVTKE